MFALDGQTAEAFEKFLPRISYKWTLNLYFLMTRGVTYNCDRRISSQFRVDHARSASTMAERALIAERTSGFCVTLCIFAGIQFDCAPAPSKTANKNGVPQSPMARRNLMIRAIGEGGNPDGSVTKLEKQSTMSDIPQSTANYYSSADCCGAAFALRGLLTRGF